MPLVRVKFLFEDFLKCLRDLRQILNSLWQRPAPAKTERVGKSHTIHTSAEGSGRSLTKVVLLGKPGKSGKDQIKDNASSCLANAVPKPNAVAHSLGLGDYALSQHSLDTRCDGNYTSRPKALS